MSENASKSGKRPGSKLSGRTANSSAWQIRSDSLEAVKDSFYDIRMTQHLVGEGCGYRGQGNSIYGRGMMLQNPLFETLSIR
jgi:hypothetical protein